ncbi:MAG: phosphodiester glycosidase family protein, partial [Pyrinomonadaceae bacterium]
GLYDLAALLLDLGATDAMNLDGGGSTTMFLDGSVVNHPSDKEGERAVSDALVVTLRKTLRPKKRS